MNRRHRADDYRRAVERLRRARPDIALSSDFIVGFPGETEADFRATLALVEEVGFAQAFSFKYSPRPGTPAATMRGQVKDQVKTERLAALQALLAGAEPGLSGRRPSAGRCRCCSSGRGAIPASWSAGRPISRRSTSAPRAPAWAM